MFSYKPNTILCYYENDRVKTSKMVKRKNDKIASADGPLRKRSRRATKNIDKQKICEELYKTVRNCKDKDGRLICQAFIRAPSRKSYPDYYQIVSNPIDLMRIQKNLKYGNYKTEINQFDKDFHLLIENAKRFYKTRSREYKDAINLLTIYNDSKSKLFKNSGYRCIEPLPKPNRRPSQIKNRIPGITCIGRYDPINRELLEQNKFNSTHSAQLDSSGHYLQDHFKIEQDITTVAVIIPENDSKETAAAVEQEIRTKSPLLDLETSDTTFGVNHKRQKLKNGNSAYLVFAAAMRRKIIKENPNYSFKAVSKLISDKWKNLSEIEKKLCDQKADKEAAEREKVKMKLARIDGLFVPPGQIRVFACRWTDRIRILGTTEKNYNLRICDWQFETVEQLYDHVTNVHTKSQNREAQVVCLWQSCLKCNKDGKPYSSLLRLNRHIKEKHVYLSSQIIWPKNKSKNYLPLQSLLINESGLPLSDYVAPQTLSSQSLHESRPSHQFSDESKITKDCVGRAGMAVNMCVASPSLPISNGSANHTLHGQFLSCDNSRANQVNSDLNIEEKRAKLIKKRLKFEEKLRSMEFKNRLVEADIEIQLASNKYKADERNNGLQMCNNPDIAKMSTVNNSNDFNLISIEYCG